MLNVGESISPPIIALGTSFDNQCILGVDGVFENGV